MSLPAAEGTEDVRVRKVPWVPVDVLQEIVPHLQFEDHLNLSLLSKSVYAALPPRCTHVVMGNIHQIASFAKYISGNPVRRASALRSLHICIDYPLPYEKQSALHDAQHNVSVILENAINLEELVCRGDATSDLVPEALTMSRRLSHLALQGLPPILAGKGPIQGFFPLTLRSIHVTRWYPHIIRSLPLAYILGLVSHLPALDTLTVEHHVFSLFMLEHIEDPQHPGEVSKATPLPVLPSVRSLKLLGCSRAVVHPAFAQTLARSLPKLATLHFDHTALPARSAEYAMDHLVLTNLPYRLEPQPYLDCALPGLLCLSISAPVIALGIWDDLVVNKWDTRLLELESSVTSFSELVAPLMDRLPTTDSPQADVPLRCISISTRELDTIPWDPEGTSSWEWARDDFLQRASAYFPSLCYLALATPTRPGHLTLPPAYPGGGIPVWTWWRVRRGTVGAPVEIREIPTWEGRRVREFLQEAGAEATDDFDRTFIARR
ncbi:hypothetical protein V8D89_003897 [Ganoderma adspersum]